MEDESGCDVDEVPALHEQSSLAKQPFLSLS
jgi:hypothetical protein